MKLTVKDVVKMPVEKEMSDNCTKKPLFDRDFIAMGYNKALSDIGNMEISMLSREEVKKFVYEKCQPRCCECGNRDEDEVIEAIFAKFPTAKPVSCDVDKDLSVHGVHITKDGERVDPKDFYKPHELSEEDKEWMDVPGGPPKPPAKEELDSNKVADLIDWCIVQREYGEERPAKYIAERICAKFAVPNKPEVPSVEEIEEILYKESIKGVNKYGDSIASIPCGNFDIVAIAILQMLEKRK